VTDKQDEQIYPENIPSFSKSWYKKKDYLIDVKEIEKSNGLEIGEDGTVKEN
jgi:hypothetical protein